MYSNYHKYHKLTIDFLLNVDILNTVNKINNAPVTFYQKFLLAINPASPASLDIFLKYTSGPIEIKPHYLKDERVGDSKYFILLKYTSKCSDPLISKFQDNLFYTQFLLPTTPDAKPMNFKKVFRNAFQKKMQNFHKRKLNIIIPEKTESTVYRSF